jgi:dTDP-4-amino-4,6-dideoxygalactose transaminase
VIIEKKQKDVKNCRAYWSLYSSAREGFKEVLKRPELKKKRILLPAYIGYSSHEGSGVFDPVVQTGTKYLFYHFNSRLQIDAGKLKALIRKNPGQMLLLIDYFGFKDKNLAAIKAYARQYRLTIIEDFAHAVFTFFQNPAIDFDYGLFSIHKMFPSEMGGAVLSRVMMKETKHYSGELFNYDFQAISKKRRENYQFLLKKFQGLPKKNGVEIMYKNLGEVIPQTFPVLVKNRQMRDFLYFALNKTGYGVVSLYHTLIKPIDFSHPVEQNISSRILNFPVHQDVKVKDLRKMLGQFIRYLKEYSQGFKKLKPEAT